MAESRSSRRDLFRLLGKTIADAARGGAPRAPEVRPVAGEIEAPLEDGRLVVDLATHPIPPGTARRVRHSSWPEPVLVVRVAADHAAGVTAACPHCREPLLWTPGDEMLRCPSRGAAFRLDGHAAEGPRRLRLRVYPCVLAGPRLEIGLLPPPEDDR